MESASVTFISILQKPLRLLTLDSCRYVHKTHVGFYAWPKVMEVYAPEDQQPPLPDKDTLESLSPGEKEIVAFFEVESNIEKLMHFLSLEDRKGKDKFDATRFSLFKGNSVILRILKYVCLTIKLPT